HSTMSALIPARDPLGRRCQAGIPIHNNPEPKTGVADTALRGNLRPIRIKAGHAVGAVSRTTLVGRSATSGAFLSRHQKWSFATVDRALTSSPFVTELMHLVANTPANPSPDQARYQQHQYGAPGFVPKWCPWQGSNLHHSLF